MRELNISEAISIRGGSSSFISGTLLNGISRTIKVLLDLGSSFGTSLGMIKSGKICSV